MPTRPRIAVLARALSGGTTAARAAEYPLDGSKISLKDSSTPAKRRVTFQALYTGDLGTMHPNGGSTLRIYGAPGEGDTGLLLLGPIWRTLTNGKGFRYFDKTQSAGGIES